MIDYFAFFLSYHEAIKDLPDSERLCAYDAIVRYGLYGEVIDEWDDSLDIKTKEKQDPFSPVPAASEDMLPEATEEQEEAVEAFGRTNDTNASLQWSLTSINAYDAWSILDQSTTHRVTVAVIDSGVESSHPDLVGNLMYDADGQVIGYNAIEESNDVSEVFDTAEIYGHGTHVAGIIAASANNAKGVAGVSYNQMLYPVKVFDNTGRSTTTKLLNAYQHVLENKNTYGIRVVNMSVGTSLRDTAFKEAIDQAYAAGVVSVAAAGNDGEPTTCYPCDFENVVGVINVRQNSTTSDGVSRSAASSYNNEGEQSFIVRMQEIRDFFGNISGYIDNLRRAANEIENVLSALSNSWEGEAATLYEEKLRADIEMLRELTDALAGLNGGTDNARSLYEKCEANVADIIASINV